MKLPNLGTSRRTTPPGFLSRFSLTSMVLLTLCVGLSAPVLAVDEPPHFIDKWGSTGPGPCNFSESAGMAIDSEGNVYVADAGKPVSEDHLLQFTAGSHVLGFDSQSVYMAGIGHALKVEFVAGTPVQPLAEGGGQSQKGAAPLGDVTYSGVWRGVDVLYHTAEGGLAESTYVIHPGADPSSIVLRYNTPVASLPDGGLRFEFEQGYMTESAPVAWQEVGGTRAPVAVTFALWDNTTVGFCLGDYDADRTLFIDPVYKWHTFLGSGDPAYGYDYAYAIAVDSTSGDIYVAGESNIEWNGPGDTAPLNSCGCNYQSVILKLNSAGDYQWHTFFAACYTGSVALAIDLDTSGNVYVAIDDWGEWYGPDDEEPLNSYSGACDFAVLKLDSDGAYQWHTFYGSNDMEECNGIAVDDSGNVYVTGYSRADWGGPNVDSPLNSRAGGTESNAQVFMLKLDTDGAYQWHTFYGSDDDDEYANAISVDSGGNACVTGESPSTWDGPGAVGPLHDYAGGGAYDIFVLKLDTLGAYQWHTFYGSSEPDMGYGITVDASGDVCVAGVSNASWDGPESTSPLNAHAVQGDIVILKLNSAGAYQWHTFFGGDGYENSTAITHDADGNLYVAAQGNWTWLGPNSTAPLHAHTSGVDILLVAVDSEGAYQWHTFYGADQDDNSNGIAVNTTSGDIYTAGHSWVEWSGPGGASALNSYAAEYDIFVLKLGESESVDIDLHLTTGWNMVSVPLVLAEGEDTVAAVFGEDIDDIYIWDPGDKEYEVPTTISPECGYWVFVTDPTSITVSGTPKTEWTSELSTGWNMIGSVYGDPVYCTALVATPEDGVATDTIYHWNPARNTFDVATQIEQGLGYWAASSGLYDLTVGTPPGV